MLPIKCKILSVEDEVSTQKMLESVFPSESTVFLPAFSLEEAVKILDKHRPDIILLDRVLPDGDGIELCTKVRSDPRLHSVPILILTGKTAMADKILGLRTGADDYLTKPYAVPELRARVDGLLRRAGETDMARKIRNDIMRRTS